MNTIAEVFFKLTHNSPIKTIIILLVLCFTLGSGAVNIKFNDDYRVYFSKDNVDLQAWEQVLDTYSRTDPLIVTIQAKDGTRIFDKNNIYAIRDLTQSLWHVEFVTRVDSVTNFQHMFTSNDEIVVEDLITLNTPHEQLKAREEIAFAEPSIKKRLLSNDGRVTAVVLQLMIPKEENAIAVAAESIRKIRDQFEQENPNLELRLGGIVMLNAAFDEYARADMATLFPLMFVVFCLIMVAMFRSIFIMTTIVISVIATVMASFGLTGYLGIELSPHSSVAPHIIFTITIAMGIHIALSYLIRITNGMPKDEALLNTLRQNTLPISLTSLTTAIGFLAMISSEIPPFRDLGIMCAIGVVFAFINTMLLVPSLLALKRDRSNYKWLNILNNLPEKIGYFVIKNSTLVLVASIVLVAVSFIGLKNLGVDDHPIKLFEKSTEFRSDADFIDDNLAGTTNIHFSLNTGIENGISDPVFLNQVEQFKQFLLEQDEVRHVQVISDTIKRINRTLNDDDPHFYKIDDNQEANEQFLLFYETNLPFGQEINNEVDIKKSSIKLVATIRSSSSDEIIALVKRSHTWVDENINTFTTRGVSVLVMFSYMMERLASNLIFTVIIATLAIALVLSVALRSIKLGFISLAPNLLPICVVFGFWSLYGKTLDFSAVLIFSMTLGVVVDDTVHFCSKYLNLLKQESMNSLDAIVETFRLVGPALIVSTFVLSCGFLVFSQSVFHMNVTLGILSSLTFACALLLDFTLLPLLLHFAHRNGIRIHSLQKVDAGSSIKPYSRSA